MTIHVFNDDWKNWIWSNINNGVSKQRIYSDLIKNGFDQFLVINELRFMPPATATAQDIITPSAVSTHLERFNAEKLADDISLFKVPNFLSETECNEIIEIQKQHNTRSTTGQDDEIKIDKNRISYSTFFERDGMLKTHPVIKIVKLKILGLLGIPIQYSESIQGQWYKENGFYNAHFDADHRKEKIDPIKGNRTWTCMITLNTVEQGGYTHFPKLNQTIAPTPGQAVIWYNLTNDHIANPSSLHGGMTIEQGEKFIITQWFREFPQ